VRNPGNPTCLSLFSLFLAVNYQLSAFGFWRKCWAAGGSGQPETARHRAVFLLFLCESSK
jgi:hypothetical protein